MKKATIISLALAALVAMPVFAKVPGGAPLTGKAKTMIVKKTVVKKTVHKKVTPKKTAPVAPVK